MLARVRSGHSVRHRADDVFVEVDVAPGLPSFITVGLPDSAVRESRDRVCAAIRNAGLEFPVDRIMVNLAPAEVRQVGTAFDLPMALGILAATRVVKPALVEDAIAPGELSLDGRIQPVRGVLPVVLHWRRREAPPRARRQCRRGRRGPPCDGDPSGNAPRAGGAAGRLGRASARLARGVSTCRGCPGRSWTALTFTSSRRRVRGAVGGRGRVVDGGTRAGRGRAPASDQRLASSGARVNAPMSGRQVRRFCPVPPETTRLLAQAVSRPGSPPTATIAS